MNTMKMIDVFGLIAKGEIESGAKLKVIDIFEDEYEYEYIKDIRVFLDEEYDDFSKRFDMNTSFLNLDVELIPPKEKKYLVKFNMRGLNEYFTYLNYSELRNCVMIDNKSEDEIYKIHFTKSELQSIQPVSEFLEDMKGKYELIEVEK